MKDIEKLGSGWNKLIDLANEITNKFSFAKIESISKEHGMLKIKFIPVLDKSDQYVLDSLSYRIERDSALTCEVCGARGIRRKTLPVLQCLCTMCYTLEYNAIMESASPQVTNLEPQIE